MSNYQGTFKRYEKKYLINKKNYNLLMQKFKNRLIIDDYGKITICNIYFDTPSHQLIRTSLDKPIYKEKLRLRSYGTPDSNDMVFVELKKKYKGIVYKRREKMNLISAEHYLYDLEPINKPTQITKEIDYFLHYYQDIVPAMYISYDRIAMYGVEDHNLRVTFDSNITWREEELWLECGSFGNSLLEEGWNLMEIKISGAMPIWLSHALDELKIYPASFSKYGKAYQQSQRNMLTNLSYAQ